MEKLFYVLWRRPDASEAEFAQALRGPLATRLGELGALKPCLNVADQDVAHAAPARRTRLDPPPSGSVAFWLDTADARAPLETVLEAATDRLAGYVVAESTPILASPGAAAPGQRTPGVNMVTCIERPERLSWDAWLERWLVEHRVVAIETQCTFSYVRNVVVRRLTPGAPAWSGIVEEGFPAEAVTDPMRWYRAEGSRETLERNLKRMIESCKRFLDLDRVESHPMSEYRLGG